MPEVVLRLSRWWAVPLRLYIGALWFYAAVGKLNPSFGGIQGILRVMANGNAAHPEGNPIEPFRGFLLDVVLPHWQFFGVMITAGELFVGLSLIFGFATRLSGLVGVLLFITYWLGRGYLEWPFVYPALLVAMVVIIWTRAGRTLGIDARLSRRFPRLPLW